MNKQQFAKDAIQIWERIPPEIRPKLIKNVWCGNCIAVTTIINYHGYINDGSLILKGHCEKCGHDVARLIENE